ncbi:MAG: MSMEG_4193 family putative phosphomutase [Chloroflexi bacterium]|nr:MSMEG_4193 family putative phosphomutase [Chloroflexota bacterium]
MSEKEAEKARETQAEHKPTTLLLIRHALNDWVGKKLAGWTPGVHLNEQGRRQAHALADRLAREKIAAIYSSPLERTVETAEIVAQPHRLPIRIRDGLGEVKYGDWTGYSTQEMAKKYPDLWRVIQTFPTGARFPNGESIHEMQSRALHELDAIVRAHPGETVAIVSHADVIKACVAHYLGVHLDLFQRIVISPASLTTVQMFPWGPRVVCVNDTSHVPEEPQPQGQDPSASSSQ